MGSTEIKFSERVFEVVRKIPEGKIASYGQVAGMLGNPGLARHVGFALSSLGIEEREIPWWRVVNSKGYLSINQNLGHEKVIQKALLEDEGIGFVGEFQIGDGSWWGG